jgi:MoxR-like ATPase
VARLVDAAGACLAQDAASVAAERERLLREIDANFTAASLPAELAELRVRLAGHTSFAS